MTWGIIANFHQSTFESLKIGTLMGSFYPKYKIYELKINRGVLCHDNEEWCQIWRGIDLSAQNWHEEFDQAFENLKNLHLNRLFLTKVYNVRAKKSIEKLCLMALKTDGTFEGKLTCAF